MNCNQQTNDFAQLVQQVTLKSFLMLPESERVNVQKRPKPKSLSTKKAVEKQCVVRSRNVDKRYMAAFGGKKITADQLAKNLNINVSAVNRRLPQMEKRNLVMKEDGRSAKNQKILIWSVI